MATSNQSIYESHNLSARGDDFSILKEERGALFSRIIGTGKRVLDLGCRDGALTQYFVSGNDVTGVDIDAIALEKAAARGIRTIHMDLHGAWKELHGQTYDSIVLAETLEHLYYPHRALAKIIPLLKTEGVLIGSVPNAFHLKNRIRLFFGNKKDSTLEDPTHINHFSYRELTGLLKDHFGEVRITPLGTYAQWDAFFPGMFSFDLVFVCGRV